MLQCRLGNAAGDAHHPAQPDRAPDSDYPSIDRGFHGLAVVIAPLGVLQFIHEVREAASLNGILALSTCLARNPQATT
jgi:hypothetical protein